MQLRPVTTAMPCNTYPVGFKSVPFGASLPISALHSSVGFDFTAWYQAALEDLRQLRHHQPEQFEADFNAFKTMLFDPQTLACREPGLLQDDYLQRASNLDVMLNAAKHLSAECQEPVAVVIDRGQYLERYFSVTIATEETLFALFSQTPQQLIDQGITVALVCDDTVLDGESLFDASQSTAQAPPQTSPHAGYWDGIGKTWVRPMADDDDAMEQAFVYPELVQSLYALQRRLIQERRLPASHHIIPLS